MEDVVWQCDSKDFYVFNNCIQLNYSGPKNIKTSSFFAQLDAIAEELNRKTISNVKAKALAYAAYEDTIGSTKINNYSRQTKGTSKSGDALATWANEYTKREQERIDDFNENQRNKRKTTRCSALGSTLRCTTW